MSEPMERIRNIWISGLLDPSKVRVSERYWFYTGDIEKSKKARKETEKIEKFIHSTLTNQSWQSLFNQNQGRCRQVRMKWTSNPISHSIPADVTFFNRLNYKVLFQLTPFLHIILFHLFSHSFGLLFCFIIAYHNFQPHFHNLLT
jgi:hypothetical protein